MRMLPLRFAAILLIPLGLALGQPYYQVRTLAGSELIGDGGPALSALFLNLTGVAVDPLGNLYLSDTDTHRVRKIAPNGITTTFAGVGRPGSTGDGGPASQASLNFPYGLATDYAGSVYIADLGNARIRKVTPDGMISTIAGHTPETKLLAPRNVAVDGPGTVYVADFNGHRVYRLSPTQGLIPIVGSGRPGNAGDNGPAAAALLTSPAGLTIDPAGNLFIGDTGNKTVRRVAVATGVITTIAEVQLRPLVATGLAYSLLGELWVADGNGGTLMRLPAQQTASALPFAAVDIASDFAGNSFALQGNTVRKISRNNGAVTIYAGGNPYYFAGDGGDSASARLQQPHGLALDRVGGYLYIADSRNSRIRRVSTSTSLIDTVLDSTTLSNPQALCWDSQQGLLYIADAGNHTIWTWRPGSLLARSFVGTGRSGSAGDNGPAIEAQLSAPSGVAVDDRGNVWISDTGNDRIRLVAAADGKIRTATSRIPAPAGLVWDPRGYVYVASPGANNVFRIAPTGSPEPLANSAGIWREPRALAIDTDGSLLVADSAANRITRWTPDGRITPVAGSGEAGFDGDRAIPAVSARFDAPSGLAIDSNSRILVADTNNHRVRILEPFSETVGTLLQPSTQVTLLHAATRAPVSTLTAGGLFILNGVAAGEVAFSGIPAPYLKSGNGELTVQVPEELVTAETELTIARDGVVLVRQSVKLAAAAPGVFLPLINSLTGIANGPQDPVTRGESITLRVTGEGRGQLPLRIRIRDAEASILSIGPSPTEPGILLVDVQAPGGFFPAGTFPLTLQVGEFAAQSGILVSVR